MKTFKINTTTLIDLPNINLAIGNFDGVHVGHQSIIDHLNIAAKKINGESVLLTFHPLPEAQF